jgi:hypothetical protein
MRVFNVFASKLQVFGRAVFVQNVEEGVERLPVVIEEFKEDVDNG